MLGSTIKSLLVLLVLTIPVHAGPPEDAQRVMKTFPSVCTPTLESLLEALTRDYAVHVSITFEESPDSYLMIVENPDTNSMAVIHIDVPNEICLLYTSPSPRD